MDVAGIPVVVVAAASSSSGRVVGDRNIASSLVGFQSCIGVVVYGLGPERGVGVPPVVGDAECDTRGHLDEC